MEIADIFIAAIINAFEANKRLADTSSACRAEFNNIGIACAVADCHRQDLGAGMEFGDSATLESTITELRAAISD